MKLLRSTQEIISLISRKQNALALWNGTFHGRIIPEDVAIYRLQYSSSKDEYFDRKGTIILLIK